MRSVLRRYNVKTFDLAFYYSELNGIGRKYIRYVTFVENEVLPGLIAGDDWFYDANNQLKPEFRANMDRLSEHREEMRKLSTWGDCLAYRLEANRIFEQSCRQVNYHLEGMDDVRHSEEPQ